MGNTIKGLSFSGEVIKKAVDYAKSSNSKENTALAIEIEGKDIKDVSSKTLGKLAKNAIKDGVNIFKLNETTAENNSTSVELSQDISQPTSDNTVNNNSIKNIEKNPETSKTIYSLSRIMGGAETSEADIQALIQTPEIFEIYTGQKIKKNVETEIRQYLEEMNKKNARANSIISAISDKTGLAFDYDITLPEKVAGFYDAKNKKIVLNPAHKAALDYAVVHELTHFVENKKGYSAYRKSLLKSNAYQEFLVKNDYADEKEFRTQLEKDYKKVYGHLSQDEFNEAIDYEIAAKISEYLINSEPAVLKRLANKDTGIKAVFRDIMEFFNEIIHKLSGESEKAYAMKMARKFRNLIGESELYQAEGIKFDYVKTKKNGERVYKSSFPEGISNADKIKLYKERIATIFNLGAVELKTDTKKIIVRGDKFTYTKNEPTGRADKQNIMSEKENIARLNALYDLADILSTSTYVSRPKSEEIEPSYKDKNIEPKNKAHKDVKYWYKFRNNIELDGVSYEVTFNIRDKGKEQYEYLIDFKEKKVGNQDHTIKNNLRLADYQLSKDNIPYQASIVNTNSMQDTKKYSITKDSDTSDSNAIEKPEVQKRTMLISQNKDVSKIEDIRHKASQKIFKEFSIPVNQRTDLKSLINAALKTVEQGNSPSEVITSSLFNLLEKNSKVVDDSVYNQYKDLKELIRTTKLHFSERVIGFVKIFKLGNF